jgi:hypothetical protein
MDSVCEAPPKLYSVDTKVSIKLVKIASPDAGGSGAIAHLNIETCAKPPSKCAMFVTDFLPLHYNKEYEKFSVKADTRFSFFCSIIDNVVSQEFQVSQEFRGDGADSGAKFTHLLNDYKSDVYWVRVHINNLTKCYTEDKKELPFEELKTKSFEARLIFKFGPVKKYFEYICYPIYVIQLQVRNRKACSYNPNMCLFDLV